MMPAPDPPPAPRGRSRPDPRAEPAACPLATQGGCLEMGRVLDEMRAIRFEVGGRLLEIQDAVTKREEARDVVIGVLRTGYDRLRRDMVRIEQENTTTVEGEARAAALARKALERSGDAIGQIEALEAIMRDSREAAKRSRDADARSRTVELSLATARADAARAKALARQARWQSLGQFAATAAVILGLAYWVTGRVPPQAPTPAPTTITAPVR